MRTWRREEQDWHELYGSRRTARARRQRLAILGGGATANIRDTAAGLFWARGFWSHLVSRTSLALRGYFLVSLTITDGKLPLDSRRRVPPCCCRTHCRPAAGPRVLRPHFLAKRHPKSSPASAGRAAARSPRPRLLPLSSPSFAQPPPAAVGAPLSPSARHRPPRKSFETFPLHVAARSVAAPPCDYDPILLALFRRLICCS